MGGGSVYIFTVLPIVFEGITNFLSRSETIDETGTKYYISGYSDYFIQTIDHIKEKPSDLLLIDDACLDKKEFLNFINDLFNCTPSRRIIIYTGSNNPTYLKKLMYVGIKCILHKKATKNKFIEAMSVIGNTGAYIDELITATIHKENIKINNLSVDNINLLSTCEKKILDLVSTGLNNGDIANQLFISYRTVEIHKTHIAHKLGLKSRRDLLKYVLTKLKDIEF